MAKILNIDNDVKLNLNNVQNGNEMKSAIDTLTGYLTFSKEEHIVGKWVDDTPLYSKTVIVEVSSGTTSLSFENRKVVGTIGLLKKTTGSFLLVNTYEANGNEVCAYSNANGSWYIRSTTAGTVYVTFFYTK